MGPTCFSIWEPMASISSVSPPACSLLFNITSLRKKLPLILSSGMGGMPLPGRRSLPGHAKHIGNGPLIPVRVVGPKACFVASAEIQIDAGGVDGEAGLGSTFDVHGLGYIH